MRSVIFGADKVIEGEVRLVRSPLQVIQTSEVGEIAVCFLAEDVEAGQLEVLASARSAEGESILLSCPPALFLTVYLLAVHSLARRRQCKVEKTAPLRQLNDAFRKPFRGGNVVLRPGVSPAYNVAVVLMVRIFSFTPGNNLHAEHDFGNFAL